MLEEKNKNANIDLDALKTSVKRAQFDLNICKENYTKLLKVNKDLLAKQTSTKEVITNYNADYSEKLPRKKRKRTKTYINNTNNSITNYIADKGLILINNDGITSQRHFILMINISSF